MVFSYFLIGLGGALGAMARVALTRLLPHFFLELPIAILCVNVIGCFAMGLFTEILALHWNASFNMRHFLNQGFLGGFTTFSAFALEFGLLYEKGNYWAACIYAVLSIVLSLGAFFAGLKLLQPSI